MPGPGEPLWLPEDRAWALALHANDDDRCGGCGQPFSESSASENEFSYTAAAHKCHACAQVEKARRAWLPEDAPAAAADGLKFFVHHD